MILSKGIPYDGTSFNRRNRLARLIWQLVWLLLFRPTPPPAHVWRCWLLRRFGAKIHPSCHVYSSAKIWAPWNLVMAENSCLGPDVNCYSMALIQLGKRAIVSQGVYLCTGSHDYTQESFQLFAEPILIDSDVWICAQSFVAPGVRIGEGAVIGARSVVTRSQPPWFVCAGNPAKCLKPRDHPRSKSC